VCVCIVCVEVYVVFVCACICVCGCVLVCVCVWGCLGSVDCVFIYRAQTRKCFFELVRKLV
jgi:hypothetical protein